MSQQINLFNPSLVKKKSILTSTTLLLMVVLSLLMLTAVAYFLNSTLSKLKASEALSDTQVKHLQAQLKLSQQSFKPQNQDPKLVAELENLRLELADSERVELSLDNDQLGNTQGYSDYFAAFARQIPNGVWITGLQLEGAGESISVSGKSLLADQVPVFVNQLKREKIMQGKAFAALHMQRPFLEPMANPGANANANLAEKKPGEFAPYLEFELHSAESKEKKDANGRVQ